jgi:hypothetical protein
LQLEGWELLEKIIIRSTKKNDGTITEVTKKELLLEEQLKIQQTKAQELDMEIFKIKKDTTLRISELENTLKNSEDELEKLKVESDKEKKKILFENSEKLATTLLKEKLTSEKVRKQVVEYEEEIKQLKMLNDRLEKIKDLYKNVDLDRIEMTKFDVKVTDGADLSKIPKEENDNWKFQFFLLDQATGLEIKTLKEEKGKVDEKLKSVNDEVENLKKEKEKLAEENENLKKNGFSGNNNGGNNNGGNNNGGNNTGGNNNGNNNNSDGPPP